MIHVALIQLSSKHTEILGTFIEIILKMNWNITIFYNIDNDEYTFVNYYKTLFDHNITVRRPIELLDDKTIDYYIVSSSCDCKRLPEPFIIDENLAKRTIYVHHQAEHHQHHMMKNITVSPNITFKNVQNYSYILPIYKIYKNLHWKPQNKTTIFAIVGGIRITSTGKMVDRNLDFVTDIIKRNPDGDYQFWFFMRKLDWIAVSRQYKFLRTHPKIVGLSGLNTDSLIKSLHRVKFILPLTKKGGWFYWQRLTGSIPLAINLNIPLVMDKKLANIYNLENTSICYEENPDEIFDNLLNMSDEEYFSYIEKSVKYKAVTCKQNEKKFISLLAKQI